MSSPHEPAHAPHEPADAAGGAAAAEAAVLQLFLAVSVTSLVTTDRTDDDAPSEEEEEAAAAAFASLAAPVVAHLRPGVQGADAQARHADALARMANTSQAASHRAAAVALAVLVAAGAPEAVVAALRAWPAHPRVQAAGCHLLSALTLSSRRAAGASAAVAAGGIAVVADALCAHAAERSGVMLFGCAALLNMLQRLPAAEEEGLARERLVPRCTEVCAALIAGLRAHGVQHAIVAQVACRLLNMLNTHEPPLARRLADAGMAAVMRMHAADVAVQVAATDLMYRLCVVEAARATLVPCGAAAAAVAALRAHGGNNTLLFNCCAMLFSVEGASRDAAGRELLGACGLIDALVDTLRARADDVDVARLVCRTLAEACDECPPSSAVARAAGALPAALAALETHRTDQPTLRFAGAAMVSMCHGMTDLQGADAGDAHSGRADAAADGAGRAAVIALLSMAAKAATRDESSPHRCAALVTQCCFVLADLCISSDALRACALEAGACAVVVAALDAFPSDDDDLVQSLACKALTGLCFGEDSAQRAAGAAGAARAVVAALTRHTTREIGPHPDDDVKWLDGATTAVLALKCLTRTCVQADAAGSVNAAAAVAAGALPALVAILNAALAAPRGGNDGMGVAEAVADALVHVVGRRRAHRLAAAHAGTIVALMSMLRAAHASSAGAYKACSALCGICKDVEANVTAAVDAGALPLIIAALRAQPHEKKMQGTGSAALAFICASSANHRIAAAAAGGVEAVTAALCDDAFADNADMQRYFARALAALLTGNERNAKRAVAAGAPAPLVRALRQHGTRSAETMSCACDALHTMGQCGEAGCFAGAADDAGAVEAVVESLRCSVAASARATASSTAAAQNAKAQKHALLLLEQLTQGTEARAARAVRAGALELPPPAAAGMNGEEGYAPVRAALQPAARAHDTALGACVAGCLRCGALRAACDICALEGCGARCRMGDTQKKLLRCGACRAAAYCGVAHQHTDWPRHKADCKRAAPGGGAAEEDACTDADD
jgi:hypothetical protein